MADISSISGSASGLSLVELLSETQKNSSSILDTSTTLAASDRLLASTQNKRAQSAYGGGGVSSTIGQAALKRALSEMGASGKVTFSDIADYREQLELEFSATVRVDLAKLGVSLDTEFTLTMSPEGKVGVDCDDPVAKGVIEKYLADNSEVCEQFGYIQALSNLERARQSSAGSQAAWQQIRNDKQALQAQAVEIFFDEALSSGSMSYGSLLASFAPATEGDSSASTSFYAGLNFTV